MFKKIFSRDEDEDDEVFETVDPVLEQRRKEKFSAPLIYCDEEDKKEEAEVLQKKDVINKPSMTSMDTSYHMSEIISPMVGLMKSKQSKAVKVAKPKVHKPKKDNDELVPIISPFYGPTVAEEVDEDVEEIAVTTNDLFEDVSVENNLRNIAHIVAEEKDQLKIIEERTGEFKLDFKNDEESFIDEIDDTMSLDELMSLYENKFKD